MEYYAGTTFISMIYLVIILKAILHRDDVHFMSILVLIHY